MLKIAIIFLLASISLCLHGQQSIEHLLKSPRLHLQNETATPNFESEFKVMKSLVEGVNKSLTQSDPKKYEFLITKSSEILAGLNKLRQTLLTYNLSISNSSKVCPGVTTFNRTELRKYISYTEQKQRAAVEYLSTCLDCGFVSNDFSQIQNLTLEYIQQLNKTLDGAFCDTGRVSQEKPSGIVNLNTSYFKNNLKAKNWYYGSTTASDYKIYIFKRSASYNLTNCPIAKPFVNDEGQVCFNCQEGSIFNLGSQKCDTCKSNEILNIKSGKCDSCLGEKKFIDGSLVCKLCVLANGELFNETTGTCYQCSNDSYLDTNNHVCIKIDCNPNTPRFNRTTKQCEACGPSEMIDPKDVTRCMKTNYIGLCSPAIPRYDAAKKQCVACENNTIYNKDTGQCDKQANSNQSTPSNSHQTHVSALVHQNSNDTNSSACPSDKPQFNTITKQCQACQLGNQFNPNSKNCEKKLICGPTQILNKLTWICVNTSSTCRVNEVYVEKINKCLSKSITCNEHQYYNPDLQTCISISNNCLRNQYYDVSSKQCVAKEQRCKGNENYNEELNICEKLILCRYDEDFNFQLRICEKKSINCLKNQYFDPNLIKCVGYSFITSPYSANLISAGNFPMIIQLYQDAKKLNANIRDCPVPNPYYQKSSKLCISCSGPTPYFDLQSDQCVSCPSQLVYEPSHHQCTRQNLTSVSSTINRIDI